MPWDAGEGYLPGLASAFPAWVQKDYYLDVVPLGLVRENPLAIRQSDLVEVMPDAVPVHLQDELCETAGDPVCFAPNVQMVCDLPLLPQEQQVSWRQLDEVLRLAFGVLPLLLPDSKSLQPRLLD